VGVASLVLGALAAALFGDFHWSVLVVCLLAAWVVLGVLRDLVDKLKHKGLGGLSSLTLSYWGMQLSHLGLVVCALGIVLSSQQSVERDLRMAPGDTVELGGYRFIFEGTEHFNGPNYTADRGSLQVLDAQGAEIARLHPEKRLYQVQQMPMTEAGIDAGFTRDLYVALGEPLEGKAWAVRIHIKSFVRWIWLGGLLVAAGGVLAALDRRYRLKAKLRVQEALNPKVQGA